jgi:hypothetical protein
MVKSFHKAFDIGFRKSEIDEEDLQSKCLNKICVLYFCFVESPVAAPEVWTLLQHSKTLHSAHRVNFVFPMVLTTKSQSFPKQN